MYASLLVLFLPLVLLYLAIQINITMILLHDLRVQQILVKFVVPCLLLVVVILLLFLLDVCLARVDHDPDVVVLVGCALQFVEHISGHCPLRLFLRLALLSDHFFLQRVCVILPFVRVQTLQHEVLHLVLGVGPFYLTGGQLRDVAAGLEQGFVRVYAEHLLRRGECLLGSGVLSIRRHVPGRLAQGV